jgi:hypothetical protein
VRYWWSPVEHTMSLQRLRHQLRLCLYQKWSLLSLQTCLPHRYAHIAQKMPCCC